MKSESRGNERISGGRKAGQFEQDLVRIDTVLRASSYEIAKTSIYKRLYCQQGVTRERFTALTTWHDGGHCIPFKRSEAELENHHYGLRQTLSVESE